MEPSDDQYWQDAAEGLIEELLTTGVVTIGVEAWENVRDTFIKMKIARVIKIIPPNDASIPGAIIRVELLKKPQVVERIKIKIEQEL